MLRRLLKYDFLSVWKSGWGTLPAIFGCTLVAIIAARSIDFIYGNTGSAIAGLIIMIFCLFGAMACVGVLNVLAYMRFYKNLFTDEGYLTFTLPVKRSTLLISKMLNIAIWSVGSLILLGVCIAAVAWLGAGDDIFGDISYIFGDIGFFFTDAWDEMGAWSVVYILEQLAFAIAYCFFEISMVCFSISHGAATAKKSKFFKTVGIYLLTSLACSFVIPSYSVEGLLGSSAMYERYEALSSGGQMGACAVIQLVIILIHLAVGLVLYFMTLDKISRRLNLE